MADELADLLHVTCGYEHGGYAGPCGHLADMVRDHLGAVAADEGVRFEVRRRVEDQHGLLLRYNEVDAALTAFLAELEH